MSVLKGIRNVTRPLKASLPVVAPSTMKELFDASPRYTYPRHMSPFIEVIESSIAGSGRYAVVAAPPQHGKTVTIVHGLILTALNAVVDDTTSKLHGKRVTHSAFITYNMSRTATVKADFIKVIDELGIGWRRTGDHEVIVRTPDGEASVWFTSIDGTFTGSPISGLMVVDDPYSGPKDVLSAAYNKSLDSWDSMVAETRRHKTASMIVMATRWTNTDYSSRKIDAGWNYVRMPAMCDNPDDPAQRGRKMGELMLPERKDYTEAMKDEMTWQAMYQQLPVTSMLVAFQDPSYVVSVPNDPPPTCVTYGLDLGGYGNNPGDPCVCVRIVRLDPPGSPHPHFYVDGILREQVSPWMFMERVSRFVSRRPGGIYMSGTGQERSLCQGFKDVIVRFTITNKSKVERAMRYTQLWNTGHVFVVEGQPNLLPFINEHMSFIGDNRGHDDTIDAASDAIRGALNHPRPNKGITGVTSSGRSYMGWRDEMQRKHRRDKDGFW